MRGRRTVMLEGDEVSDYYPFVVVCVGRGMGMRQRSRVAVA